MPSPAFVPDHTPPAVCAEHSLLRRYGPLLRSLGYLSDLNLSEIDRTSAPTDARSGEGAALHDIGDHRGVRILLVDESSHMATGTYKALDACLTTAYLRAGGTPMAVLSSAGNLGRAMAHYASKLGIRLVFFHPRATQYKLDREPGSPWVTRIAVDLPEPEVKALAASFAARWQLPLVPDPAIRQAASAARAAFLWESAQAHGPFDWLTQAICAGFGPIGIYDGFSRLVSLDLMERNSVPHFLGLQQDANAPLARALAEDATALHDRHIDARPEAYLEPGLYNTRPAGTYPRLRELLQRYGGQVETVDLVQVQRWSETVFEWLGRAGLEFAREPGIDGLAGIRERAGLLAGVGLAAAINRGSIEPGQRVAYLLTGGVQQRSNTARGPTPTSSPDLTVDSSLSLEHWILAIGERLALA